MKTMMILVQMLLRHPEDAGNTKRHQSVSADAPLGVERII
jgi:hypothetical protein